jgi:Fe-S-cluster-containing hydrogenase component 2
VKVDQDLCMRCGKCLPYCPMLAIRSEGNGVRVVQDECVECGVCRRAGICPTDALIMPELAWPRMLRSLFSNPLTTHRLTNVPGRGTEEMKTNEVTGRIPRGQAGMAVELGRPGTGARLGDVQTVAMALAGVGARFQPCNPVTGLMTDLATGRLRAEALQDRPATRPAALRPEAQKKDDRESTFAELETGASRPIQSNLDEILAEIAEDVEAMHAASASVNDLVLGGLR